MRKFFYFALLAILAVSAASATETVGVKVNMNTTATTLEIQPLENQALPELRQPIAREYEFQAVPGTKYKLVTYNKNNQWVGSLVISFDADEAKNEFSIFTPAVKIKNSGWVFGTDCIANISLTDAQGNPRSIETSMELGYYTFPAVKGDVYTIEGTPAAAHESEGYIGCIASDPVTFNRTISLTFPMSFDYAMTVPTGSKLFVGLKKRHFLPFIEIAPSAVIDNANGTSTYHFRLGEKVVYNYRLKYTDNVSGKDYITVVEKFTMPSENTQKEYTLEMLENYGNPKKIITDPTANKGYNVSDIYLNADYRGIIDLKAGQRQQIVNLRNWEITDNITNNYFFEPDYHYQVVDENGVPSSDVATVDASGMIVAKKPGTAIILVTYDAMYAEGQLGGPLFGAIEPQNTGVIVLRVDAPATAVVPNTFINQTLNKEFYTQKLAGQNLDAEHDVIYFTGASATYTFYPENVKEALIATPTIEDNTASYSGFSASGVKKNADGSFALSLGEGRNIVKLVGEDGNDTYQVIRARKCSYTITNNSRQGEEPMPGDELYVTLNGIYHPAGKLGALYNMNASVQFTSPDGEVVSGTPNQYQFASNEKARSITVTIPEDWNTEKDFTLSSGAILCSGYGDPYGSHRYINYTIGRSANFTALLQKAYLSVLPDIVVLKAAEVEPEEGLIILDFEDDSFKGNLDYISYKTPEMTAGNYWSSLIDSPQYSGPMLYPARAPEVVYGWYDENNTNLRSHLNNVYGDGRFWNGGTVISNYTSDTFENANYEHQLEAYTPQGGNGGYKGSENFLVAYGFDDKSLYGIDSRPIIEFNEADGEPQYVYITLGTYALNAVLTGDAYTPAASEGDWVDITAEGLDSSDRPINGAFSRIRVVDGPEDVVSQWTKWDLSTLGKCRKIRLNVESNMVSDYGMTFPACYLLDNFAVKEGSGAAGIEDVSISAENNINVDTTIYDLMGRRLERISVPGIYIIGGKKVIVK